MKALVRFEQHDARHQEEDDRVRERSQNLDAVVTIGAQRGCGALCHPDRKQRQAQASHVGQHVPRIRKQRETARGEPATTSRSRNADVRASDPINRPLLLYLALERFSMRRSS